MRSKAETVYMLGDRDLVVEFAQSCLAAGFNVAGGINGERDGKHLPAEMKRTTVVPRA